MPHSYVQSMPHSYVQYHATDRLNTHQMFKSNGDIPVDMPLCASSASSSPGGQVQAAACQ